MLNKNYLKLKNLRGRLYFSPVDLQDLLQLRSASALVLCSRYVKNGFFIRLKRNFYALEENWEKLSQADLFRLSNVLQVPSYISFMTALSFYEITTQVQRNFYESACLKRSKKIDVRGRVFNFYKLKKELYFDFFRKDDIFLATKEKAFVDSVYLYSFGKYKLDFASLDIGKLDKQRVKEIIKVFPQKTREIVKKLCKI